MNILPLFYRQNVEERRFEQIRPRLFRVAYSWSRNRELAEDLTQETLIRGLKHLAQLQDEAKFDSWLFTILHNCWRDHFRKHVDTDNIDEMADTLPSDAKTPENEQIQSQLVLHVRQAVASLPIGQRQVVTLVDLEEFSYMEVACILEIPIGTVMSRLCRARQSLQTLLKEHANTSARATGTLRRIK